MKCQKLTNPVSDFRYVYNQNHRNYVHDIIFNSLLLFIYNISTGSTLSNNKYEYNGTFHSTIYDKTILLFKGCLSVHDIFQ